MLVATQSFSYVDPFDGEKKAVHRGRTRIADDHPLACRFPHRWQKVDRRHDARVRFRHALDGCESYDQYVEMLDQATDRLAVVEERGEYRVA